MFKITRHFFYVFMITTVIPLVLMFLWTNHQMENMRQEQEQHFLNAGLTQLKITTNNYLKLQESYILEKIQILPVQKMSLTQLKKAFDTDKIQWIQNNKINKVVSYYETIKSSSSGSYELYNAIIIPFYQSNLKIEKKVDFNKLRPNGPFDVELYYGDKINNSTLLGVAKDPFMPPHPPAGKHYDEKISKNKMPQHEKTKHAVLQIKDNNNKNVATLLIKPFRPFHPDKPIENNIGLIILFAGSSLSILASFYINKNFIKPLIILSEASVQVQKGNLVLNLNTNSKQKQIINTFENFNKMVKELKEKEDLRKSFITSLTHDLRTPLIAQERSLTFISKKMNDLYLQEEYELAKSMEGNNKHLLRMVNLILESYQFDSKNIKLEIISINLSDLVNNCHKKLSPLLLEKNIQFFNNISADFPFIQGDLTCLKRIFLNLIGNAVENIGINDNIQINAEIINNFAVITVEDNGTGIAKEDLNHIFDRYFSGKSLERKIGAGLGLDVCKKLVELHNGVIYAESEVGKFTRFVIKLPLIHQKDRGSNNEY